MMRSLSNYIVAPFLLHSNYIGVPATVLADAEVSDAKSAKRSATARMVALALPDASVTASLEVD